MSTRADRADDFARAAQLRAAAALVEQFAPEGYPRQQRDKVDVLRRLGLLVAQLERHEGHALCRRCHALFSFDVSWFEMRGLSLPRHCDACRAARRQERHQAGVQDMWRKSTTDTATT